MKIFVEKKIVEKKIELYRGIANNNPPLKNNSPGSNSDFGGNYNNSPIKFGPPQAENFGDFGTPKMRFLKGETLKTGPKKVPKIVLIKTPKFRSEPKL